MAAGVGTALVGFVYLRDRQDAAPVPAADATSTIIVALPPPLPSTVTTVVAPVPHPRLHRLDVGAGRDQQRREMVPQIVEAEFIG